MEKILKGAEIRTKEDFHKKIKELLDFPDYYGENLDALWDCLTGYIDRESPLILFWDNFEISKLNLGEFADAALNIFKDAESEMKNFKVRI